MNPWPSDAAASAELLRMLVANIDRQTFDVSDRLLGLLLTSAWPTGVAQDQ